MKVYIYKDVDAITDNYHDGGGLVIITDRGPVKAWRDHVKGRPDQITRSLPRPDLVIETADTNERVFVFPDAGCC